MALTGVTSQGFEPLRETCGFDECLWVPGDPGDTYTRGDVVSVTDAEGVMDPHAAGEYPVGVVLKTITCTANTTGYPKVDPNNTGGYGWGQIEDDNTQTLVPIMPLVPRGTPVLKVTFASHTDDDVTSWTASTRVIVVTSVAANDDHNGGLIYIHTGPGVGQWNTIEDSVAATNHFVCDRIFTTVPTSASDVIYLGGAAADDAGISFFSQITATDQNNLNAADGGTDGEFRVYLDARDIAKFIGVLQVPVIPSALNYHA